LLQFFKQFSDLFLAFAVKFLLFGFQFFKNGVDCPSSAFFNLNVIPFQDSTRRRRRKYTVRTPFTEPANILGMR
jgi:hypothetical protein